MRHVNSRDAMSIKQCLQLLFCFAILLGIVLNNIKLGLDGYYTFYYGEEKDEENIVYRFARYCTDLPGCAQWYQLTGMATGYGFFSPNVASDFVVLFELKDANGQVYKTLETPLIQSKEGNMRFYTFLGVYMDKILSKEENKVPDKYERLLDVMLKQLGLYVKRHTGAQSVGVSLYLYDYPSLREFQLFKKPRLILLQKYDL
jgi:hypothetical protein